MEADLRNLEQNLLARRISETLAKLIENREDREAHVASQAKRKAEHSAGSRPLTAEELEALFAAKVADLQPSLDDRDVRLATIGVIKDYPNCNPP